METNIYACDLGITDVNELVDLGLKTLEHCNDPKVVYKLRDILNSIATVVETDYITAADAYEVVCDDPPRFEP